MPRTSTRLSYVAVALLAWLPAVAAAQDRAAQDSGPRPEPRTAPWRVGVFVGGANDSPVSSSLGVTPGRDHRFIGVDAQTTMLRLGPLRLNYALQILPAVLLSGRAASPDYPRTEVPGPDRAYAFGLSPFGFELATPAERRVAVYGAAAAGGLVFNRPVPVPEAQRINFTLEYGGGALVRVGRAHWVRAGYKYHHLSNAYTARLNPGVDGHVLYAGYQWAVRLPR